MNLRQRLDELLAMAETDATPALIAAMRNAIGPLLEVVEQQHRALEAMRSAYPHEAPFDCFSTGPLTGDALQDFVACPGCAAEKAARAALSLMDKEVK